MSENQNPTTESSGIVGIVMRRARIYANKGRLRLFGAVKIFFGQYRHWVILNIDEDNLVRLIDEQKDLEVESMFCGLQPYNVHQLVKRIAKNIPDEKMILEKAAFQGEVELRRRDEHGAQRSSNSAVPATTGWHE